MIGRVRLKSNRDAFSISPASDGGALASEKLVAAAAARREGSGGNFGNARESCGWVWGLSLGVDLVMEDDVFSKALGEAMIMFAMAASIFDFCRFRFSI